jgi:hypothetical protein
MLRVGETSEEFMDGEVGVVNVLWDMFAQPIRGGMVLEFSRVTTLRGEAAQLGDGTAGGGDHRVCRRRTECQEASKINVQEDS